MASCGVSMTLRTSSTMRIKKRKCSPMPEDIPNLTDLKPRDTESFFQLKNSPSIENQIIIIRQAFKCFHNESNNVCEYGDLFVQLFFMLPGHSTLRKLILSCFNKLPHSVTCLTPLFEKYLQCIYTPHLLSVNILRCFDNCWPAKAAALNSGPVIASRLLDSLDSSKEDDLATKVRALLCLSQGRNDANLKMTGPLLPCLLSNAPIDVKVNAALCIISEEMQRDVYFLQKAAIALEKGITTFDTSHWLHDILVDWPAKVSFCHALLVVASDAFSSAGTGLSAEQFMLTLFEFVIKASQENHDATAVLQHTRVIYLWIQRFDTLAKKGIISETCLPVSSLESYIWSFIGSSQDSVKHNVRNTLSKMVVLLKSLNPLEYSQSVGRIVALSWSTKDKYVGLLTLIKNIGCRDVLEFEPELPKQILRGLKDRTVASHCVDLYDTCLKCEEGSKHGDWMGTWVNPLLTSDDDSPEIKKLFTSAIHLSENVLGQMLSAPHTSNSRKRIRHALLAIKVKKGRHAEWKDYLTHPDFVKAQNAYEDQTRMDALECIYVSRSSAEYFSEDELTAASVLIKESLLIEDAAIKQTFLSLFKKILLRLSESTTFSKRKDDCKLVEQTTLEKSAKEFLKCLEELFFSSLFTGANFHRRATALDCLRLLSVIFPLQLDVCNGENGKKLLALLEDSYEQNKENALLLLQRYSSAAVGYDSPECAAALWERCLSMCDSKNPSQSASASYLMLFVMNTEGFKLRVQEIDIGICIYVLNSLLHKLTKQINKMDRLDPERPMYGFLLCIRKVIQSCPRGMPLDQLRPWSAELLTTCQKIHRFTCEILNNSCPEGSTFDESLGSSQAILLSAWRSCKEVSLLFAELTTLPWALLDEAQVEFIVDFFVGVMSDTVHRGAFEQAFVGFSEVCVFLWGSRVRRYRKLIEDLLSETLKSVSEKNFCLTRRSAGIPFLIQAILTSQSQETWHLKEAMITLLEAAESRKESVRIQAFNILRALYRNTTLGESINTFAENGFNISINGFKSFSWAERNAASLLFSALITRVFGVKRDSNEFSQKNAVTVRVFFQRFSNMFETIRKELHSAAQTIRGKTGVLNPSETALYPILIILAKLIPSPITSGCDQFQISEYTKDLLCCCRSSILKIRELAAKVLVRLFPAVDITNSISNFTENHITEGFVPSIFLPSKTSGSNEVHGHLILVKYLVKTENQHASKFGMWLLENNLLNDVMNNNCSLLIKSTVLDIMLALDNISVCHDFFVTHDVSSNLLALTETIQPMLLRRHPWAEFLLDQVAKCCLQLSSTSKIKTVRTLLKHPCVSIRRGTWKALLNLPVLSEPGISEILTEVMLCADDSNIDFLSLMLKVCNVYARPNWPQTLKNQLLKKCEFSMNLADVKIEALTLFTHLLNISEEEVKKLYSTPWAKVMEREAGDDQFGRETMRECVAECLLRNKELYISNTEGIASFILWKLLLSFSFDDMPEIRQKSVDIYCFLDAGVHPITPMSLPNRMAEICLEKCVNKPLAMLVLLGESFRTHDVAYDMSEFRVFERCEINSWREEEHVQSELLLTLQKWLDDGDNVKYLKEDLPDGLKEHIRYFCQEEIASVFDFLRLCPSINENQFLLQNNTA